MSLTHFDARGQAHMVDVSGKPDTAREAVAEGCVVMTPGTLALAVGDVRDRRKSFICLFVYLFISLFVMLY